MRTHCGVCHEPSRETAKPAALAVFDLEQERWWASMSDAQLVDVASRYRQRQDMSDEERAYLVPHGSPPPARPSDLECEVIEAFVERALRARD